MSTAFHAYCADPDADDVKDLLRNLSDEERAALEDWQKPSPIELPAGPTLRYEHAEREFAVALDRHGQACDPDDPDCLTAGHPDAAWVFDRDGSRYAYVLDLKRSRWTASPDSLQIRAYAYAVGVEHDCDVVVPGVWDLENGGYDWGQPIRMASDEAISLWFEIRAAASHDGQAITGPHCTAAPCWGRMHCPEHLLPAALAAVDQSPLTVVAEDGDELTADKIVKALELVKPLEDILKAVKDKAKAYVRLGGVIEKDGWQYGPVVKIGRESVSVKRVREVCPDLADRLITRGKSYEEYRWKKTKK